MDFEFIQVLRTKAIIIAVRGLRARLQLDVMLDEPFRREALGQVVGEHITVLVNELANDWSVGGFDVGVLVDALCEI